MLKDQIDQKIKQIGLSFEADNTVNKSRGSSHSNNTSMNRSRDMIPQNQANKPQPMRAIDGLIQLTNYQQLCEQLKAENN